MKNFVLCLLMVTVVAASVPHNRGCLYSFFDGSCKDCPENTRIYVSACSSPTWSERTCDEPERTDMGPICDLARCDCDEPLVKDTRSGKCVKLEDCPKN